VSFIFEGRLTNPTAGSAEKQNFLPAWSPDGTTLAFTSNRDGNSEIYTVNRDGSGMRRLTNHPAIDVTPTWSPTGNQIAFTSDRTGSPQIWVMNADGSEPHKITNESKCDRPTWSVSPNNEIAYASQTGAGFDIRIYDFATGTTKTITDGIGSNESPAFSPNGRHVAFTSTRAGKAQIFVIDRDGKNLRQITRAGMNRYPNWSQ
jgi:TolB protein